MKKLLSLFLIFTIFLSSCGHSSKKTDFAPLNIAKISVKDSVMDDIDAEFRKINSGFGSSISHLHYDQVAKSLMNGSVDAFIGTIEIPLDAREVLKKISIAKDGVVIVVNPANPIRNLSKSEVISIFSGLKSNWKLVGGDSKPIMVIDRDKDSIEKRTFDKLIFNSSVPRSTSFVKVDTAEEVKETLIKFANSISYVNYSSLDENIKAISFDNIPATEENISKGYFPLSRNVGIYFNPDHLKKVGKYKIIKKLAEFLHSKKGQEILSEGGLIPLSEAEKEIASINSEPIYIGVAAPTQGTYTDLGRAIINGAKLAVLETNEAGGIDGKLIELVICDDKATSNGAINCAKKLAENNVLGVVGHLNSQASIEASKIYVKNNIAQITPASTHPWFTERPDSKGFVFRTIGRDDQQAKLIANKIRSLQLTHPLKVSIFHNSTVYGSTLSAIIEDEVNKYAIDEIVEIKAVKKGSQQFFEDIQGFESNVLVFVGEYGDAATILKALALNNNKDTVFIGSDGTYSQRFIEEAGLRSEGAYIIGNSANIESVTLQDFTESYKELFKTEPNAFGMNSYDATNILLKAIENSKMKHPVLIAKEIGDIQYDGLTGFISFDEIGDPILPRLAVYRVSDNKFIKLN